MAIFYRGAGVGTWWHTNDPQISGFVARSPGIEASPDRVMQHIVRGTTASPYVSLTRSYGVALSYAMAGRVAPAPTAPAFVWEIEINDPLPAGLVLVDPIKVIAGHVPDPLGPVPYQHDGAPSCLIALIDTAQHKLLSAPSPMPPNANPPPRAANISIDLQTLVFALRDAEILAIGAIPAAYVRFKHEVY